YRGVEGRDAAPLPTRSARMSGRTRAEAGEMAMEQSQRNEVWAAGDLYEPYVGRWSRLVAREFLDWLAVPAAKDWLDVGCGTGALTQTILDRNHPRSLKGVDASAGFVEHAKAH